MKKGRIKPVNRKRMGRRRERQFGRDGKREWVMAQPDAITGEAGTAWNPVDPAHIHRTRGAGAGSERLLPLRRTTTHRDYDVLGEEKFDRKYARYGVTRAGLTDLADDFHRRWLEHRDGLAF